MSRFLKIGQAAKVLGVSVQTLRRWEANNTLIPTKKVRGTRYYDHDALLGIRSIESDLTVAYALRFKS